MKKLRYFLFVFIFLLVSCSNTSTNTITTIESTTSEVKTSSSDIEDDVKLSKITYDSEVDSIEALAKKLDTIIFNSKKSNIIETTDITVGDNLKAKLKESLKDTIYKAAYCGALTQNHFYQYDATNLDNNILNVTAGFKDDYATTSTEKVDEISSYTLDYYLNVVSKNYDFNYKLSDLPIMKKASKYVLVSNSEQLFYALEEGYIPYVKDNSEAKQYLEKAIATLSKIVDINLDEYSRYRNIFNYVINSNQYDYNTLLNSSEQSYKNKCFYLEGAFDNNFVVCDGLTKELVVLSRLAGIECYHVGASNNTNGHAYNYVRIDDKYYLSCPTSSMLRYPIDDSNYKAYYTNTYFLTTLKTNSPSWEYDSLSHLDIKNKISEDKYDYYKNTKYLVDGEYISTYIENKDKAIKLFRYINDLALNNHVRIEIELNGSNSVLKEAYKKVKDDLTIAKPLSTGAFDNQRLNVYQFGE